jgi:hypothetical protein
VRGIVRWLDQYDGRGVINKSYADAAARGTRDEGNRALYEDELMKETRVGAQTGDLQLMLVLVLDLSRRRYLPQKLWNSP